MGEVWTPSVDGGETWGPLDKTPPFNRLGPIADPIDPNDAATKEYVDTHSTGGTLQGTLAARPVAAIGLAGATYDAQDVKNSYICQQTSVGVYSWVPISQNASAPWKTQTDWGINSSTGNDAALGTAAAPLATWTEFRRRCLAVGGFAGNLGLITVQLFTNLGANDPMNEVGMTPPTGTVIFVKGIPSVLFSGTFTAVTLKNPATNTAPSVTDSAIPASWTASGGIRQIGVITSGTSTGAYFSPIKDLGGKSTRISELTKADPITSSWNPFNTTNPNAQVGDGYSILVIPTVPQIIPDPGQSGSNGNWIHNQIANIGFLGTFASVTGIAINYLGCSCQAPACGSEFHFSTIMNILEMSVGSELFMQGGAIYGFASIEGLLIPENVMGQGVNFVVDLGGQVQWSGDFGIFDSPSSGIIFQTRATGSNITNSRRPYGVNTTFGVICQQGGSLFCAPSAPPITGGTSDFQVDSHNKSWADFPYFDSTTGSGVVQANNSGQQSGTFTLNGTTPVIVPANIIQASDLPVMVRTALLGSPGQYSMTAISVGVSFTVVGQAGDVSTFKWKLDKG